MNSKFVFTLTTLACLACLSASATIRLDRGLAHSPSDHAPSASPHQHRNREIPKGQPIPSVNLVVHPDAIRGWNLELKLTNFKFAPERVNQKSIATEGHAHLYVNGKKVARLYGNWFHLATLEPGRNTIKVTLNTNTHEDLIHDGQPIQASAIVEVPSTAQK